MTWLFVFAEFIRCEALRAEQPANDIRGDCYRLLRPALMLKKIDPSMLIETDPL